MRTHLHLSPTQGNNEIILKEATTNMFTRIPQHNTDSYTMCGQSEKNEITHQTDATRSASSVCDFVSSLWLYAYCEVNIAQNVRRAVRIDR